MSAKSTLTTAGGRPPPRRIAVRLRRAFQRRQGGKRLGQRQRIVLWALLIGAVCGLIELPMPAEDAFKAARAELRLQPTPDDIVVVEIDDRTLNALQVDLPDRFQDAAMVDAVFAAKADRLVFDRAYADPASAEEDAVFAETLAKHRGRVWLGASPAKNNVMQEVGELKPTPSLSSVAPSASMYGETGAFGLSVRFPTSSVVDGERIPSISSVLAGHTGDEGWYRPDLAIAADTIRAVSYVDVLNEETGVELAGKAVVVTETHVRSSDFSYLPLGDPIPGAYFHVLGAHTLKAGFPADLGWGPAMLIICLVLLHQARRKRPARLMTWTVFTVLPVTAAGLDYLQINVDIFPALIAFGIGTTRLNLLANRLYSRSTQLVMRDALKERGPMHQTDVYALKIVNLADVAGSDTPRRLGEFVERVVEVLRGLPLGTAKEGEIAFEKDTLIWQAASVPRHDLADNAAGLIALLRLNDTFTGTQRIEVTLAIEANRHLELATRLHNAVQAAELASRRRNQTIIVDKSWLGYRERHVSLLTELDRGLREGSIAMGYQPKVDLVTGQITGAEALLRWEHSDLGYIQPAEAVSVAEEHDRIDELTVYVIERAMSDALPAIRRDPDFKLAVNVSAQTLAREMLVYHLARLSSRLSFPGRNLMVEVTETAPLQDDHVLETIHALRRRDISFSIDDFGTGHSNLTHLANVPSAELKIDRSFVGRMLTDPKSEAVVRSTIDLAHSLGKTVVAEGVEDQATADRLRELGCELGQGYLYSHAVPMNRLLPMLKETRSAA